MELLPNFLHQIISLLLKSGFHQSVSTRSGTRIRCVATGFLLAAIIAGCSSAAPTSRPGAVFREATVALPTGVPTPNPSPVSTRVLPPDSLTPEPTPTITPFPDEARGLVVDVIDGDTIVVVMEGDPPGLAYEVRYLGIDAPPNTPSDPWGVVAYETNRRMTKLKIVNLVRDVTDIDDEGRLLRYVFVDNQLMSIILTEQGLARAESIDPDTQFRAEIEEAEARARNGSLGLWGSAPPTPSPTPSEPTAAEEEGTVEPETTATPGPVETSAETVEPEGTEETPTDESTVEGDETTVTATATEAEATPQVSPTGNGTSDDSDLQGP